MKRLRIAVIGSGISGLSAAWLLSKRHDVQLIEADGRLGGHSNTVACETDEGSIPIDTGFIVYNSATYPNLTALLDLLKVQSSNSNMGFGVSLDGGHYEYSGSGPLGIVGSIGNLVDAGHWRMLRDIARFFTTASAQSQSLDDSISLGKFMFDQGYSQDFLERHLTPMAGAIWSSEPQQMLDYPARSFLQFFESHGLLKFSNRPQWRTVVGGSREYIAKLLADSRISVTTGWVVRSIERRRDNVILHAKDGSSLTCDHVVLATHADQALAMIHEPMDHEIDLLSPFCYRQNRVVLHRDATLMPRRRRLWSSWNYLSDSAGRAGAVTYWMNALQPLATTANFFVTLNPQREPATSTIERQFSYEHPMFNSETAHLQKYLWNLQGHRRTWFCGAYFGAGFHEDGLQSGLAVAEELGGLLRPWSIANPSSRIHVTPRVQMPEPVQLEAAE